MTNIVPTIGRIVLFTLTYNQAADINRRRQHARNELDYHRWKKDGTMIHIGNDVAEGDVFPAVIVRVWGNTPDACVNLKVMLDGSDDYWVTSAHCGDHKGDYQWMSYQLGQAAKTEQAEKALADSKSAV